MKLEKNNNREQQIVTQKIIMRKEKPWHTTSFVPNWREGTEETSIAKAIHHNLLCFYSKQLDSGALKNKES